MEKNETEIVIESRIHLFSALAEAAEIEHNLMCLYLYSMFGLKRHTEEGVTQEELAAIERWRKVILGICLEEMSHLSLVSNLISSLGGTPHFLRPNFPASPGMYPADIVIELAPFDMKTLDHFIYLEHPADREMQDSDAFVSSESYERVAPKERLMPTSGDYKTVGVLYEAIKESLIKLCKEVGESELFCGNINRQITPIDSPLKGLIAIKDLKSALTAIETIITQGEGANECTDDSHYIRFSNIKKEYQDLLNANPNFEPGRRVARNPVMRKPISPEGRVWVNHPVSARYMDLANAFYGFMLRVLIQVYVVEDRDRTEKHEMLQMAFTVMHMLAVVGETLTLLPSSYENPDCFAGMSFAMVRTLSPLSKENELFIMIEGMGKFSTALKNLQKEVEKEESINHLLSACVNQLAIAQEGIDKLKAGAEKLQLARKAHGPETSADKKVSAPKAPDTNIPVANSAIETAESDDIRIQFNAKKCIHSRHCVTECPEVFKANTPGKWLFPEQSPAEVLAAVIKECPSGALTYESKTSNCANEVAPSVNIMRLYENGPYAFLADLEIDGKNEGLRATLCRCGQSKRKPFCDHTHADVGFIATGEPDSINTEALEVRGGNLKIDRTPDGPYSVKGNVEICAGTGRIVLRTSSATLCRCGHSKSKPLCDGTHAVIGFRDAVKKSRRLT